MRIMGCWIRWLWWNSRVRVTIIAPGKTCRSKKSSLIASKAFIRGHHYIKISTKTKTHKNTRLTPTKSSIILSTIKSDNLRRNFKEGRERWEEKISNTHHLYSLNTGPIIIRSFLLWTSWVKTKILWYIWDYMMGIEILMKIILLLEVGKGRITMKSQLKRIMKIKKFHMLIHQCHSVPDLWVQSPAH